MKALVLVAGAALALALPAVAQARGGGHSSGGSHSVSGYTRSNGTHVESHHATNPNGSKSDNWSTRGNVNPYTGQVGTKSPY